MTLLGRSRGTDSQESLPEAGGKSRARKFLQGGVVFVVMFVVLWTVLSRTTRQTD